LQEKAGNGAATQAVAGGSVSRETLNINLKDLLNSPDSRTNVLIYPGDVIKVTPAGVVYVVGEVKKPGGFVLKTNENISVLQALALAEGPTRTSARSRVRIIRNDGTTGARIEIPIDLGKILAGKLPDPILLPKDIVFVPNSAGRSVLYRSAEAAIGLGTGMAIYRR
jgi:polysaccharide export outer membrane protein